ncbi:MAG: hypothetical protein L3J58_09000 [Emcibacter sp.]|nr:hypothetical protein [Emcibacter sp.]
MVLRNVIFSLLTFSSMMINIGTAGEISSLPNIISADVKVFHSPQLKVQLEMRFQNNSASAICIRAADFSGSSVYTDIFMIKNKDGEAVRYIGRIAYLGSEESPTFVRVIPPKTSLKEVYNLEELYNLKVGRYIISYRLPVIKCRAFDLEKIAMPFPYSLKDFENLKPVGNLSLYKESLRDIYPLWVEYGEIIQSGPVEFKIDRK